MKTIHSLLLFLGLFIVSSTYGQDCLSKVKLILHNTSNGGFFVGQTITLSSVSGSKSYEEKTNAQGEAVFELPCDERFEISISNYPSKDQIKTPPFPNSVSTRNYSYQADIMEKRKAFAMNEEEKVVVDKAIDALPDTSYARASVMTRPRDMNNYASLDINLKGLENEFLVDEEITFVGQKRNKAFKAHTDSRGHVRVYLPKGDMYLINFKYHGNYRQEEVSYSKGTSEIRIDIQYMGTKVYLKRKKEEEERLEKERKMVLAQQARLDNIYGEDMVLETVLDRNEWEDKLFIIDISYEMMPYSKKLANWYKEHKNTSAKNAQFVFFFNGTLREGTNSSSAFHYSGNSYDSLMSLITYVHGNVGLEKSKHDIAGLIENKGIENDYKEVVLLIDKDRGMVDYQYFVQIGVPVHVILCVDDRVANAQHLTIALKTGGTIHTFSGDYDLSKMVEGDKIEIEGTTYQIMGGEFIYL